MPVPSPQSPDAHAVADELSERCLALRLRLLTRVLVGAYDTALRPLDLTASQMTMLAVLTKAGPMPQARLAEILSIEKSTLSRNVQRMAKRGWIEEHADGSGRLLSTSGPGRAVLERAYPLWCEAQRHAESELGSRVAKSIGQAGDRLLGRS